MSEIIPFQRKCKSGIRNSRLVQALAKRESMAGLADPLTITLPSEIAKRVRLNAALFSKTPEAFVQDALFGAVGWVAE